MSDLAASLCCLGPLCSRCNGRGIVCVLHDEGLCFACRSTPDDVSLTYNWQTCALCKGEGAEPYRHLQRLNSLSPNTSQTLCGLTLAEDRQSAAVPICIVTACPTCPTCIAEYCDNALAETERRIRDDEAAIWAMARQTMLCSIADCT